MAANARTAPDEPRIDWAKEIDKWQYGIDMTTASAEEINIYTQAKSREYKAYNITDTDLWELY